MGYIGGMRTAISIPDEVFDQAERLADRMQTSRSQLYARALAEFVARHDADHVTEGMNRVVDEIGETSDAFIRQAADKTLRRSEW